MKEKARADEGELDTLRSVSDAAFLKSTDSSGNDALEALDESMEEPGSGDHRQQFDDGQSQAVCSCTMIMHNYVVSDAEPTKMHHCSDSLILLLCATGKHN